MKKFTTLTGILSWSNLIVGGFITLVSLFGVLVSGNALAGTLGLLLTGSIVLHSYAALQLRKSILQPQIPLDSKTPTGIRFIGFLALMFAVMNISNAFMIIKDTKVLLEKIELPAMPKGIDVEKMFRIVGYFILVFSLSVAANTIINFSMLRWYKQQQEPQ